MKSRIVCMLLLVGATLGCLTGKTTSTIYIEGDDSVSWQILETDIRSTAKETAAREREERDFLRKARRGENDAATVFDDLAPDDVDTVIVRDELPYAVATTARFRSAERLAQQMLDLLEIPAVARLDSDGDVTRLSVDIVVPDDGSTPESSSDEEEIASDLGLDVEIVVVDGRFVETRGFVPTGDGRVRFAASDELQRMAREAGGTLRLALGWTHER